MPTRSIALAALLLTSCDAPKSDPVVREARIIASPMGGAAYFTVTNKGSADRLLDVDTPGLGEAALHSTTQDNGIMRMRPVDGLDLPANSALELKPGGHHVMIMGDNLEPGTKATLVLKFQNAEPRQVETVIEGAGTPRQGVR